MSATYRTLLFFVLALLCAMAQIDRGTIVGIVLDSSGAPIPGATLSLTNAATKVALSTTTNAGGQYLFPALNPGVYSVKASASGFSAQVVDNIEIHVQSRPSVDFQLKVGQVDQVLEVQANSAALQTESADVGNVVGAKQIVDLPLNGRRYSDLALLEPGVQRNLVNQNNKAPDRFSANGNLETQNYFSLDGVDNNSGSYNLQEGSVQAVQPPPDALQEFRVQTRTYSAEFGTAAGAIINASIKSGSNEFHGAVWEFLRNDKLEANSFFNNRNGVPRGPYRQNQYGGSIGGPIVKNRSFFFFDMQDFTSRKATTLQSTVPTPLMKQGNFTELAATLRDSVVPSQTGCITGNVIAAGCLDPVAVKLFSVFPDPNIPSTIANLGQPRSWTGGANYQYQYSTPTDNLSWDTRIDHNWNDANRIFGRYSQYNSDRQDPPWTSNPLAGNGNFATQYDVRGKSVSLSWTSVLSPSAVNEVRGGFQRSYAYSNPIGLELGKSAAADFGLNGIPDRPNNAGLPPINITGFSRIGTSPWRPQFQVSQVWQFLDNFSVLKGSHSYKVGYEYRRNTNNFMDLTAPQGQFNATGIYTGNVGNAGADFLLGNIASAQYTTPTVAHNYLYAHSFFAQDTWRARRNLTVTYGLRYEFFTPILNRENNNANFSAANGGSLVLAKAGSLYDRALIHPDRNNFAPRVGFSYSPISRVALRGGFGLFYQHVNRIGGESVLAMNPPAVIDNLLSQANGSTTPVFLLRNGVPSAVTNPSSYSLQLVRTRAQDPNQRTSYVNQVSFGPQIELSKNTILDVSYVGNFGRKLNRLRNANQGRVTGYTATGTPITVFPYENLNSSLTSLAGNHAFLQLATNDGNTNYNGLLVSLRRSYTKGVAYGVSYTLSRNFADYVDQLTGGSLPADAYNYSLERGNSPFDVRHKFVAYGVWALPIGKGGAFLNKDGVIGQLAGGWQLNAVLTQQTGLPFSITAPDNSSTGANHSNRASCVSDPFVGRTTDLSMVAGNNAPGFWLNPAAFAVPALGTFGNCAPRNHYGPGLQIVDLSLFKSFVFKERYKLEFRAEAFNAFNHANFSNPNSNITAASLASFGRINSTITAPREYQLALKFYY